MSDKIGALAPSIVAALVAGGVFFCLGLIIVVACILDLPKRAKRKAHTGIMEPSGKRSLELADEEKGNLDVSTTEISSTNLSTNYSSARPTRPTSPVCTCEHPTPGTAVSPNPPRI